MRIGNTAFTCQLPKCDVSGVNIWVRRQVSFCPIEMPWKIATDTTQSMKTRPFVCDANEISQLQ